MKYTIVHDMPGRIRLRCGRNAFSLDEGYSITSVLMAQTIVTDAKASSINGSLLIFYVDDSRSLLLDFIDTLVPAELPVIPPAERDTTSEVDADFQYALAFRIVRRLLFRGLLPSPVRHVITLFRAVPYVVRGIKSLLNFRINVDVLDASSIGVSLAQRDYGTASSIMFLLSLSDLLEDYTRKKTKLALAGSLSVNVDTVWKQDSYGNFISTPISQLEEDDTIIVRTSGTIPVDGTICEGEAYINEACMTGESQSVLKKAEDSVYAGTVVEDGSIVIKVRAIGNGTRMNKIIELIDQSENLKADVQSHAENLADSIVPFSFLASGLAFLLTRNATKAASVLLVDYSCAIKLATPISVISAMREAANHKIVVKGGKFLESYALADTIVFDKTGTLTVASPSVSEVIPFPPYNRTEVLKTSACLEEHFPHSVAHAIVHKAEQENLKHREEHAEVEYVVAHGIRSKLHGKKALIGSYHFIVEDEGIPVTPEQKSIIEEKGHGKSAIFLALGDALAGMICIDDPLRPEAAETIQALRESGIKKIIMLTGDSDEAARDVSAQLGITEYQAQILPEDKASVIERLKEDGHQVIMVGDGINDSPALAAANVSVSMKDSSDIAREVADITLLSTDLRALVTLRHLSLSLMEHIQKNFHVIIGFNSLLLAGGLIGFIPPATSAFLHNFSTMFISAASMRPCLKPPV